MATETNDLNAHNRSIRPQSINMLNGRRYGDRYLFDANQVYRIPQAYWEGIKDKPDKDDFLQLVQWYVNDHFNNQLPRILELERYYAGDNNIHYWMSRKNQHADNRIASGLPRYITNIQVGYQFGSPLTFGYTNKDDPDDDGEDVTNTIEEFNHENDEQYHEKIMGKNLANTGRAYELMYLEKDTNDPKMTPIDPNSCFVVWSTDVEPVELFAVRYYVVNLAEQSYYQIEVYTDDMIYYFGAGDAPDSGWTLSQKQSHHFNGVPITEYSLNEERIGKWEPKLDEIDGYDQALSEMANSQEDYSNATLMISGKVANNNGKREQDTFPNGEPMYTDADTGKYTNKPTNEAGKANAPVMVRKVLDTHSNALFLKPYEYQQPNGTKGFMPTTAAYLTKSLDANEWQIYIQQLLADVHKDTNTPDTTDQNFSANASGVAMAYKLWGSDQEMALSETLYKKGIKRRLRLLTNYWSDISTVPVKVSKDEDPADNVTVTFTPNLPKNNQEVMQTVAGLVSSGDVSKQTIREQIEQVTGIPADQEKQRVDDDNEDGMQKMQDQIASLQGQRAIDPNSDDGQPNDDNVDPNQQPNNDDGKQVGDNSGNHSAGTQTNPQASQARPAKPSTGR